MRPRPIRSHHRYITVDQIATARDQAAVSVREHLETYGPDAAGDVPALVVALVQYDVDYREVADRVQISGLDVLRLLRTSGFKASSRAEIGHPNDAEANLDLEGIAQVYRAGLVTEREEVEDYREQVLAEQRAEVLRLLATGHPLTTVARDVGVTRGSARAWMDAERPDSLEPAAEQNEE